LRVLIAEDDAVSRHILETLLVKWGYDVATTLDGNGAWEALQEPDAPSLAILDVMMPGIDGLELCRQLRQSPTTNAPPYVILLTATLGVREIVKGIEAGADDYLTKPYDRDELRVRLQVGARMIDLQTKLAERVRQLEDVLHQVKQLEGILPICSYCKRIRDDRDYWQSVDQYITDHSEAHFSHGICPECFDSKVQPALNAFQADS